MQDDKNQTSPDDHTPQEQHADPEKHGTDMPSLFHHGKGTSFGAKLRGYLIAGILVTAPISITLYLSWIFIRFVDTRVSKILPPAYNPETYMPFSLPGLGLVIVVVFLFFVGFFAANFLGRFILRIGEALIDRMPFINTIYGAIKQIMETVLASKSQAFREAVMLEYPRKGVWSIGFVTGTSRGEVQRLTKNETVNVFVPTTPNPTSGYLLFVPRKDLHFLEMTVEEAIKLVVSAGIVSPPDAALTENNAKNKGKVRGPDAGPDAEQGG